MGKPKPQAKKARKGGVDFQKIKRKIGRRLPPPKNTTNTEVKSKAIVLPEQSVATDKTGFALSKKGLTLKELLQHTNHHNAKVRKDALLGVKDILLKHPAELKLHKLAVIEKLRERIGDDDKVVRETLYQLFKSVIFPSCEKDNQGQLVSLMMAYIFNAMTHLAIDVRLMAFKFSDLVVQSYPSSFLLYADKILQNYGDMLRRNQLLEDKGKLKSILSGFIQCLSSLPSNEREYHPAVINDVPVPETLHAYEPEVSRKPIGLTGVTNKLTDLLPVLVNCCEDFMPAAHTSAHLDVQSFDCLQSILESIDLIVRFLVSGISESEPRQQSMKSDVSTSDSFQLIMMLKKLWDVFPLNLVYHLPGKEDDNNFMLNSVVTKIFLQLSNWDYSPSAWTEKFLEFIENSLFMEVQLGKVFHEKHLLPLLPFIPELAMQITGGWRWCILQAFTEAFMKCNPESSMKLACLSAIEEMLAPERTWLHLDAGDTQLLHYQIAWIHNLPLVLNLLDDKNPLCSKAVLHLQLRVGRTASVNSPFSWEYDSIQFIFKDFFSNQTDEAICYGPFTKLAADVQDLAIDCLYYFSTMDSQLLQSLVSCCLCDGLKPYTVSRILEVLQSSFRAGHIQVAEYTSFHVTLLSRFKVYPENTFHAMECDENSNWTTFKYITSFVCSCLSEIGDNYLVFQMLEKIIVDQICGKTPMGNKCAFLRLLITLDSKPTRLSDQSILSISNILPQYLMDIVSNGENNERDSDSNIIAKRRRYYLLPSLYLFNRSKRLLELVLNAFGAWISNTSSSVDSHHHPSTDQSTAVCATASVILHMYKDVKFQEILLSCKTQLESVTQNLLHILSSEEINLSLEERHKIQSAGDRLRAIIDSEVVGYP